MQGAFCLAHKVFCFFSFLERRKQIGFQKRKKNDKFHTTAGFPASVEKLEELPKSGFLRAWQCTDGTWCVASAERVGSAPPFCHSHSLRPTVSCHLSSGMCGSSCIHCAQGLKAWCLEPVNYMVVTKGIAETLLVLLPFFQPLHHKISPRRVQSPVWERIRGKWHDLDNGMLFPCYNPCMSILITPLSVSTTIHGR